MDIKKEYERWLANATADADVVAELKTLDDAKIEDAFYRDLAFGTGGLRGVIGAGTNRMNVYTVAKASQGLADYLKKNFETPSVAIGYDSRIKSDVFAKVAAVLFSVAVGFFFCGAGFGFGGGLFGFRRSRTVSSRSLFFFLSSSRIAGRSSFEIEASATICSWFLLICPRHP